MVDPQDVPRILNDAARLVGAGELVVFGSAAFAFWLDDAPRTRDIDVWCEPSDRGDIVEALMGEMSWYHDKHGAWVERWAPETFAAPEDWRTRAREVEAPDASEVRIVVPHPYDLVFSKLERLDPRDTDHIRRALREWPMDDRVLDELAASAPHRTGTITDPERLERFERGLSQLRSWVSDGEDS